MAPPRVTVAVVVRNGMPFLSRAVDSILGQTMPEFELLVVNDGSTDGTAAYLASVSDPRLRTVHQEPSGIVAARNRCLAEASGPLIAQLDADDLAEPERLARQLSWFDLHADASLLGGGFDLIDPQERWLQECLNVVGDAAIRWALLLFNPFAASAVMYRRADALAVGGFRPAYETSEDYDMWARLAGRGSLDSLPERLCLRRVHPGSVSLQQQERQADAAGRIAGEYAATLGPGFDAASHAALLAWFVYEAQPDLRTARRLSGTYERARRWFRARYGEDAALNAIMAHTGSILRYRCRRAAKRSVGAPLTAMGWLWNTRAFVPRAV